MHQLATFISVFVFSGLGLSAEVEDQFDATFDQLAHLNSFTPVESAGSHGSFGASLGVGLSQITPDDSSSLLPQIINQRFGEGATPSQYQFARVTIVKGTPWPIDFGFSAAKLNEGNISQAAGYLQATVFEKFQFPSVAARLSYSELIGLTDASAQTTDYRAVISYGFMRYFNLFVSGGQSQTNARIRYRSQETLALDPSGSLDETKSIKRSSTSAGATIYALPPYLILSGEFGMDDQLQSHITFKLNTLL